MRAMAVVLISFLAFSGSALASRVDVSNNRDAKKLYALLTDTGNQVMPCLIKESRSGKSRMATEAYCFCRNRNLVRKNLRLINKIWARHPQWKGKDLVIVSRSKNDTEKDIFGYEQISHLSEGLKNAAKSCP